MWRRLSLSLFLFLSLSLSLSLSVSLCLSVCLSLSLARARALSLSVPMGHTVDHSQPTCDSTHYRGCIYVPVESYPHPTFPSVNARVTGHADAEANCPR
ncbi:hypothetical protein T484DRAFT_2790072 [Baffinella frigidus]|nr:hypothetical protein T484DRAFT_2790072 [Cryptophyta sp. CCMP2293]